MQSIYDKITGRIVQAIEAGANAKDWRMPWHRKGASSEGMPINVSTGNGYQGANVLVLWAEAQAMAYATASWATYKQWQTLGAQVRKGEHGTACIKWKQVEDRRRPADASQDGRSVMVGLGFTVFNAAQVDGWTGAEAAEPQTDLTQRLAHADQVIAASGATIRHEGARAYYRPSQDLVVLPERFRFIDTKEGTATQRYYSTTFHELAHWTGAEARCNRSLRGRFGDEAYAAEELIAELSAAFTCGRLGIDNEPRDDHAQYLASWLKVLKNDTRAIFTAASQAQKATAFLLDRLPAPIAEPLPLAA